MMDFIDIVRTGSQVNINLREPLLIPDALPTLHKRTSQQEHLKIKIPDLTLVLETPEPQKEEQKQQLIDTNAAEYVPPYAFCDKVHERCGHQCRGVANERECLPCLHSECPQNSDKFYEGVDEAELCTICYT